MKKVLCYILLISAVILQSSCSKKDNYTSPSETLTGNVIDSVTGKPIQTEEPNGIRIQLLETSWSSNPDPLYFWAKSDGTFKNTKIFNGTYTVTPVDGPYFPITGKSMEIKGVTEVDFKVVPYLNVNFADVKQSGTSVDVSYTISRSKAAYKITDAMVFVSTTPFVGNNAYILNLTKTNDLSGADDQTILSSTYKTTLTGLTSGYTYYIRVGARTNDPGSRRYNYTEVRKISIP